MQKPKVRGFICINADKDGCRLNVEREIQYMQSFGAHRANKSNALIIGCSTGYGLSSRAAAAYIGGAATVGVMYEREESHKRTASAGWYNDQAFLHHAHADALYAATINGDAFSDSVKTQTIQRIKQDLGSVNLVIYSLAAPSRLRPSDGVKYNSALKPISGDYTAKTVDPLSKRVYETTIPTATPQEIDATVKVMGGEDLALWVDALHGAGVLAQGAQVIAYSYVGSDITRPIYGDGTIGRAKRHLENTVCSLNQTYADAGLRARVAVNKAVVTQASAAIPVMPLYMSLLMRVMQQHDVDEGCAQQIKRLFCDYIYGSGGVAELDGEGRVRLDQHEMRGDIQQRVAQLWHEADSGNIERISAVDQYYAEFLKLFGFYDY